MRQALTLGCLATILATAGMVSAAQAGECDTSGFKSFASELRRGIRDTCGSNSIKEHWRKREGALERWKKDHGAITGLRKGKAEYGTKWKGCQSDRMMNPYKIKNWSTLDKCEKTRGEVLGEELAHKLKLWAERVRDMEQYANNKDHTRALDMAQRELKTLEQWNAYVPFGATPESAAAFKAAIADANKRIPIYKAGALQALKAKPCPKGKKRNKGLEKKLKKAWRSRVKIKNDSKFKLYQLKTNDKVYKETKSDGSKVETIDTWVCFEKLQAKTVPKCHYDRLSFSRKKARGKGWTAWQWGGVGENGPLFCNMAKK